jgi:hypothetical protein
LAEEGGLLHEGDDPSAFVIEDQSSRSRIVVTAPFGPHAAILSIFNAGQKDERIELLFDEILANVGTSGLTARRCEDVPGLKVPSIYSGPM